MPPSALFRAVAAAAFALPVFLAADVASAAPAHYAVIIKGGEIVDGSGEAPFIGDVAIDGGRIALVSPHIVGTADKVIDATGQAVAPGFINMLAHPEESLMIDGRAQSDLRQGVTLEVMGEDSMGPLNAKMHAESQANQGDVKYVVDWTTLGGYLDGLERRGMSVNVASFVGAGTVRTYVLGAGDVQPTPEQLEKMQGLVRQAMEEGALGVTTALIYSPNQYAKTPELIALAKVSARCGGLYSAHMRSEADRVAEAVDETIDIARQSGGPAEIYHLKLGGRDNWGKLDGVISQVEAARASGVRISADMYVYEAGATGLDAGMPPWVLAGGLDAWIARLKDPKDRARLKVEMKDAHAPWENLAAKAGPDGMLFLSFNNERLKPYIGKTLSEVARIRKESPEETMMDLVIEDHSRTGVAYFLMSEDNIRREVVLPWVSFGSDEAAPSTEGAFLKSKNHPRAFGNFDRVLGKYVREEKLMTLQAAVRKLSAVPADTLSLKDRGLLKPGFVADVVVFDPATIADHATYERPQQYSTGVSEVLVNGQLALDHGEPTAARPGVVVRGRAYLKSGGACRASARDWTWGL
jgi:N-acyl-D-amino-acid deacylase